jgi:hypothetical protein
MNKLMFADDLILLDLALKRASFRWRISKFSPGVDMPKSVTRTELAKLLNQEIRRQLGGAEGCSVSPRQIAHHTEDTNGCNWHISGWFRSSRPSGDACAAIVKSATEKLQSRFKLKAVVTLPAGQARNK